MPVVTPGVEEVQATAGDTALYFGVRAFQRPPDGFPVVYDEPDVPVGVRTLRPIFGEGEELVPGVYERHSGAATTQLYMEESAEELKRLFNVAYFKGDVVEAGKVCLVRHAPYCVVCSGLTYRTTRSSPGWW